ncbi:MAG: signal recognition particle-docking protein FtsY [Myxococcaceae bacterium]|nr:MAG: signal recognition particle-docking protein FtsY [Myxococcaceae bacterium]
MDSWLIILLLVVIVGIAAYLLTRKGPQLPAGDEAPAPLPPKPAKPAEAPVETVAAPPKPAAPAEVVAPPVVAKAPAAEEPVAKTPEQAPVTAPVGEAAPATAPTAAETAPAPVVEAPAAPAVVVGRAAPAPLAAPRDVAAVKRGLAQTRGGFMQRLFSVFSGKKEIDPALLEEIEETLLTGDVGVATTKRFVDGLRDRLDRNELSAPDRVWDALREDSKRILAVDAPAFGSSAKQSPLVILMVGVNGAGKTTTTAKLAGRYKQAGQKVLLAAADTFRAAAVQQLEMWGTRVGVTVHKAKDGAKPSAVVYEAVARGVAEGFDVVIADTAGRLQNKAPLMEELRKTRDAAGKACPGAPHEVLLVLDAVTGQNALSQAKEFREALDVTGVVLTKLDGTAKGGVILAVADEFKLPVRFIGVGEKADDLRDFDSAEFVEALFSRGEGADA